jgi:HEAT repeat protein
MYLSSVSRYEWIICIHVLCKIDKVEASKRFVGALEVEDADKRFRVVNLLGGCGTEIVVPALIKILKEDPEPGIRIEAASTLGYIGDKRAIPALEWSVENDDGRDHDDNPIAYVAQRAIERLTSDKN